MTGHVDPAKPRLLHQASTLLASIALRAGTNPLDWLPRFVVLAPEEIRVSWASQVGRFLEDLDGDEASQQWERWIKPYWADRVRSMPLALAKEEVSAMARWLIGLPGVRADAVALLVQSPAGLSQNGGFLHRLRDIDLTPDAVSWAAAITHLLKGTDGPYFVLGHYLQPIVQQLRSVEPSPDLHEMIDEALRLGTTEAADW